MQFVVVMYIVEWVVVVVVDILSRAKSRGCHIYRGSAAEISVGKYVISLAIERLEFDIWQT